MSSLWIAFHDIEFHNVYGPRMEKSHVIPEQLFKGNSSENQTIEVFLLAYKIICFIDDAVEPQVC